MQSLVISELDGDALAASDHSLHSGHLVLLQGFSLKGTCTLYNIISESTVVL